MPMLASKHGTMHVHITYTTCKVTCLHPHHPFLLLRIYSLHHPFYASSISCCCLQLMTKAEITNMFENKEQKQPTNNNDYHYISNSLILIEICVFRLLQLCLFYHKAFPKLQLDSMYNDNEIMISECFSRAIVCKSVSMKGSYIVTVAETVTYL
jgi:hypothetical protein